MKFQIFGALVAGLTVLECQADVAYFLVGTGNSDIKESYVLPLIKPEDIAEARRLLTLDYTNRLFAVVRIVAGPDGINRDHLAPGKPRWSWHVTEFMRFAEGVSTGISWRPSFVEQDPEGYVELREGLLAFGSVVAELMPEQVFFVATSVTTEGARLHWLDLGTNYLYTVESTVSLNSPQWAPVSGTTWPIAATNWVEAVAVTNQPRFYRVKAELRAP